MRGKAEACVHLFLPVWFKSLGRNVDEVACLFGRGDAVGGVQHFIPGEKCIEQH